METILLKITAAILAAFTTLSTSAAALEDRIIHTGSMAVTVIDYGLAGMNGDAVLLSSAGANLLMDTRYKLDDGTDPTPEDSVEDRLRARGTFLSVRDLGTFTVHADNGVITAEGGGIHDQSGLKRRGGIV